MKFTPLSSDDIELLEADRAFVTSVLNAYQPGSKLSKTAADIPLIQVIFRDRPHSDTPEAELFALGTCLGDIFCQTLKLDWFRVEDTYGTDLALRFRDTTIILFPRSMIIKRVENGEEPELQHLYDGVVKGVNELLDSGNYR